MNGIFAAQKKGIPLDACALGKQDSVFLQQGADLTGGIYVHPTDQSGLLQYLMSVFLTDPFSRQYLNLPKQDSVDYRAACFWCVVSMGVLLLVM
eukprot:TRINITY_DN4198_c0_g1_i1.p1 TRINITY_DN4198_c0_g1~~TRINITY_DN4198_c0_g1_i1.p1  ORF type:complete len:104 (-),score=24.29 TRINITY_DN4198_c0_g1_i1:100-381(-)